MPQLSTDDAIRLRALRQHFGIQSAPSVGPCENCRNLSRCTAERMCCEAFALFARLGSDHSSERWRLAPRQPSVAILKRLRG
jgi:hypothetical protein